MRTLAWAFLALLLIAFLLLTGCWTVHQRDDATIAAVKETARNRSADVGLAARVLAAAATLTARPEDGLLLEKAARNLETLEGAEQVRLGSWLFREEQKSETAP